MKAEWIDSFATGARFYGKKWHHGMKREGIREEVLAGGFKVDAGDSRSVEG